MLEDQIYIIIIIIFIVTIVVIFKIFIILYDYLIPFVTKNKNLENFDPILLKNIWNSLLQICNDACGGRFHAF